MPNTQNDADLERCTLSGRREIVFQLRNLIRQKQRISVTFDEGRQSFLSVLIDLSEEKDTLYFDISGSEESNRAFLRCERCQFSGIVGGIRIQFSARQARLVQFAGERVFAIALPKTLLRLQRREAFRLQLPSGKPYLCHLQRGTADEMTLPLYDISVGGLGIQVAEKPQFEAMELLENSWLDLRESGAFPITLEVRYIMATESRARKPLWHMGCRFVNLPLANETQIQRFMARIEVELRALTAN